MQGDYGCRSVVSQWNRSYRFRWSGAASCFQHGVAPLRIKHPQSPRTGIQAIRVPGAAYEHEKAEHIGADGRVRSARLLTCAFANLILAAAEELPTAQ